MSEIDTFMDGFEKYMKPLREFEKLDAYTQARLISDFSRDSKMLVSGMETLLKDE